MSGYRIPFEARCARDLGAGWQYEAWVRRHARAA